MEFGELPVARAVGGIVAHSVQAGKLRLKKGRILDAGDVAALVAAGVTHVTVARPAPGDMAEDAAAERLGAALSGVGLRATGPMAGRVNLVAEHPGLLRVDATRIHAFNRVDEAITIATLPDFARVAADQLIATVKIIPYAAPAARVAQAVAVVGTGALTLHPFAGASARLILTRTPGLKDSLLDKGAETVRHRLSALGVRLQDTVIVAHDASAVAAELAEGQGRLQLVLGGSATSDRRDVVPSALVAAGGSITRFGMPVDPGNLLVLGRLGGAPVVGLPGCARAPALNGADWVLERLAAGLEPTAEDIAAMGVGGLLKEVPQRGLPRRAARHGASGQVHILLMAAGRSSRMRGDHKLLRAVDGRPLVLRSLDRLSASGLPLHVVAEPGTAVWQLLERNAAPLVPAPDAPLGLSASLRAGIAALPESAAGVIVALADMPEVDPGLPGRLVAAHDPGSGALIVAPVAPNGKRGNPVLFDRRYFEPLASLTGDTGARALIDAEAGALVTIPGGEGVLVDLDTPEAWAAWEGEGEGAGTEG